MAGQDRFRIAICFLKNFIHNLSDYWPFAVDQSHSNSGPLPAILKINFWDWNIEPVLDPSDKAINKTPFFFKRMGIGQKKVQS